MRSLWRQCSSDRKEKSARRQSSQDMSGSISLIIALGWLCSLLSDGVLFAFILAPMTILIYMHP